IRLWVDALCINQADAGERAAQVLLMQFVYHNAAAVCMWLGTDDRFTAAAFGLVQRLGGTESQQRHEPSELFRPDALQRLGLPPFPSPAWEALARLFERPYFRRIWILQEMIAAPRTSQVCCGGECAVPWTALVHAVAFLHRAGWIPAINARFGDGSSSGQDNFSFVVIALDVSVAWMKGAASPAERLAIRRRAQAARPFDATDPRDKIFALVGVVN
ncbi:heterokaryon incompatibility protein-domain-containing protein, partial [Lasiosphaeria ovina]